MFWMPTTASGLDSTGGRSTDAPSPSPHERRRERRFKIVLPGRFMRSNKEEHPCRLRDISLSGAAMTSPASLEVGERIVAYFEHIGGLEGIVARTFDGGFAIELSITQHKREKLAAQLTWLSNQNGSGNIPQRRHSRSTVDNTTMLRLAEDISVPVRVLDVSISGASVETEARPAIGSEVVLGKLRAKIVRHHDEGLGVEFIDMQNADALRRYFR